MIISMKEIKAFCSLELTVKQLLLCGPEDLFPLPIPAPSLHWPVLPKYSPGNFVWLIWGQNLSVGRKSSRVREKTRNKPEPRCPDQWTLIYPWMGVGNITFCCCKPTVWSSVIKTLGTSWCPPAARCECPAECKTCQKQLFDFILG